jgi:hypothetical protein
MEISSSSSSFVENDDLPLPSSSSVADGTPVLGSVEGERARQALPQQVYDLRGNRIGRSLSEVEEPGVYIVRQGSQTRRVVVR